MRKVRGIERVWNKETQSVSNNYIEGYFHCWGLDYEEFESGGCSFTVGIIEDYQGAIYKVLPDTMHFLDLEKVSLSL